MAPIAKEKLVRFSAIPGSLGFEHPVGGTCCHVGIDESNRFSDEAWSFLRPSLDDVRAFVFSREQFAPAWIPSDRLAVIAPSIDPFSAKNTAMTSQQATQILTAVGLIADGGTRHELPFTRRDGTRGVIQRTVDLLGGTPLPSKSTPVVLPFGVPT